MRRCRRIRRPWLQDPFFRECGQLIRNNWWTRFRHWLTVHAL